jgi:hypothetical protein
LQPARPTAPIRRAVDRPPVAVALGLLLAGLPGQTLDAALEFFKVEFRAAVQLAESGQPSALRAASQRLDVAAGAIERIADPRRRAQAVLFVAVRRATFLFRAPAPDLAAIAQGVRAARDAARVAGVWEGPYQETGLVLLWQCLGGEEFFALVEAAPEDLALVDGRKTASADNALPMRLMRADLRLAQGREREAIHELTEASAALRDQSSASAGLGDAWADKCHDLLVWRLMERREYARAEVYVQFLRDPQQRRYYTAQLANQRRDFAWTVGALEGTRDRRELLLLADALEQLGRVDAALLAYDQLLRGPGVEAELRAAAHNGRGDCHLRRDGEGDRAHAEAAYRESLRALEGQLSCTAGAEVAENHKDLGRLHERRGEVAAAHAAFARALDEIEAARAGIPLDPFGAAFLEPWFLEAVEGVLRRWRGAGADPFAVLAAIDRVKARSLLDRVGTPRALEASPEVLAAVRRLLLARDAGAVQTARLELERARVAVAERIQLPRARPLTSVELRAQAAAEPEVLVLAYWLGERTAYLVATRGAQAQVLELGSAELASERLREAYAAVADGPVGDPWPALERAGAFFVPSVLAALLDAAVRVVVCPDERLARLPFEALRVGGAPLGLRCELERAASLAVRAQVAVRQTRAHGVVVVDSVPFSADDRARLGVDALHFSAQEGDLVAQAWPQAVRLREAGATLPALRAQLQATPARILHLSTHAIRRGVVPSASLLLLADGALPLSSLTELPLDGATVLLSACSTATGEARGGEGDAALLWGPLGAGARCVVASLWPVNQQATCDLMGQVHYALARGASEAAALREARRALAGAANYAHPHYWAGFAAFGAVPVEGSVRWGRAWLPVGLGLALAAAAFGTRRWRARR